MREQFHSKSGATYFALFSKISFFSHKSSATATYARTTTKSSSARATTKTTNLGIILQENRNPSDKEIVGISWLLVLQVRDTVILASNSEIAWFNSSMLVSSEFLSLQNFRKWKFLSLQFRVF